MHLCVKTAEDINEKNCFFFPVSVFSLLITVTIGKYTYSKDEQ